MSGNIVSIVGRMLELVPLLSPQMGGRPGSPRTPQEKERVKRVPEIASGMIKIKPSADRAIDRLAHELSHKGIIYGLSEDEIKVVEGI